MRTVERMKQLSSGVTQVAMAVSVVSGATSAYAPFQAAPAIAASADLGGRHFDFNGTGECRATPSASIYGVSAAMWHVSFSSGSQPLSRVNATVWQPTKGGPAPFTPPKDNG
ncbi:MAG: hypothetical protein ABI634_08525 [Acidobacteriota bacterium]